MYRPGNHRGRAKWSLFEERKNTELGKSGGHPSNTHHFRRGERTEKKRKTESAKVGGEAWRIGGETAEIGFVKRVVGGKTR